MNRILFLLIRAYQWNSLKSNTLHLFNVFQQVRGEHFIFLYKGGNIKAKTTVGGHATSNLPDRWLVRLIVVLFPFSSFLALIKNSSVRDLLVCWIWSILSCSSWKNAAECSLGCLKHLISFRLKGTLDGVHLRHPLKVFWSDPTWGCTYFSSPGISQSQRSQVGRTCTRDKVKLGFSQRADGRVGVFLKRSGGSEGAALSSQ